MGGECLAAICLSCCQGRAALNAPARALADSDRKTKAVLKRICKGTMFAENRLNGCLKFALAPKMIVNIVDQQPWTQQIR